MPNLPGDKLVFEVIIAILHSFTALLYILRLPFVFYLASEECYQCDALCLKYFSIPYYFSHIVGVVAGMTQYSSIPSII
ncbi:hypothetical protein DOY81_009478, partial [Sarcophaga bullata]